MKQQTYLSIKCLTISKFRTVIDVIMIRIETSSILFLKYLVSDKVVFVSVSRQSNSSFSFLFKAINVVTYCQSLNSYSILIYLFELILKRTICIISSIFAVLTNFSSKFEVFSLNIFLEHVLTRICFCNKLLNKNDV